MGLAFLQAAFLAGLAAAAIPVVIHLMHRRKSRTVPFPAIRFLKEVDIRTARRSRLRERLILLLRVAALVLLALALARPVLRSSGALGRGRASRIFLMDNSMSMEARSGGSTALERSRLAALELLREMGAADRGAVLALHAPESSAPALTESRRSLEDQLLAVRPTALSTPIEEALGKAYRLLEGDTNPVKEVLVFSDLQASAFPEGSKVPPPPDGVRAILLVPRRPPEPNLTVSGCAVLSGTGRRVSFRVKVRNFGGAAASPPLSVRIDGKTVEERAVNAPAGAETSLLLGPFELSPGLHAGLVELGEDPVLADDTRAFSLEVPEALRVLIVRDGPGRAPQGDPAFYLAQACRPAVSRGAVEAKVIAAGSLAAEDLAAFEVVVLAETARIGNQTERALREFLKKGGGLLFIAGPGQSRDELRPLAGGGAGAAAEGDLPILPARYLSVAAARSEPFHLKDWAAGHPLWQPLLESSPPLRLDVPRFLSYWKVEPIPGAEVLARFTTGDPALLSIGVGRGRVLLFASTARPEWSNFPLKFSFVPFVHSALRYLAGAGRGATPATIGTPLVLDYPADAVPEEVTLRPPEGAPVTLRPKRAASSAGGASADFGPLDRPGLYVVEEKFGARAAKRAFSVSPDLAESDLSPLPAGRREEILPGARILEFDSAGEGAREALRISIGSELKNPLLFLFLALLFLEPALANSVAFRREREAAGAPAPAPPPPTAPAGQGGPAGPGPRASAEARS